jgi:hypothetical protein
MKFVIRNVFYFPELEKINFKACLLEENLTLEADPFSECRTRPSAVLASAFIQPSAAPATEIAGPSLERTLCTAPRSSHDV